ncbi:MAG: catalase [Rhizobacter sp.]|nr:catalase [Rhizobacter sp.]
MLQAVAQSGPGVAKATPIEQFFGTYPAALRLVTTPRPVPDSFGTLAFYGVNAFKFTNAKGESHFARYQILPVAGEHALSDADAAKAGPNYLMEELPQRIAKGPVKFRLLAQVANDGDNVNDPTAVWPADRPQARRVGHPRADQHPGGAGQGAKGAAVQPARVAGRYRAVGRPGVAGAPRHLRCQLRAAGTVNSWGVE